MKFKNFLLFVSIGVAFILVGTVVISDGKDAIRIVIPPSSTASVVPSLTPSADGKIIYGKVIKVFDGDTIEIEGGQKVRYIGIDAAEVYPTRRCFSDESLIKNRELVLGKVVGLEKDISETDKYDRLLRYVYVDDIFINDELTKKGYAKVMTVPPDIKYMNQFVESEKYAKENGLGLWSKCF